MITQEKVKELFDYRDGALFWKKADRSRKMGVRAGSGDTYRRITIMKTPYQESHLVWLYHYGVLPKDQIDHINGIADDNRIENLRECDQSENNQNRVTPKNNKSGQVGVQWCKQKQRWWVRIQTNGKRVHLGYFKELQDAVAAYEIGKVTYHKFQPVVRKQ